MNDNPLKIQLFYCTNSLCSSELSDTLSQIQGAQIRSTSLPCSGKIDLPYLIKAFENGIDAILITTCGDGDCRFLEGNLRANRRVEAADDLLEEVGLGRGRVKTVQLEENHTQSLKQALDELCEKISPR